ncbi:hypothetical protein R0J87_19335, partial [Halomonas sp. SIMBA_159]
YGSSQKLNSIYNGNPWALTKAIFYIKEHYSGSLQAFLETEKFMFDAIAKGFNQELKRLSNLEKQIILVLAKQYNPFPKQSFSYLDTKLSKSQIDDALHSL